MKTNLHVFNPITLLEAVKAKRLATHTCLLLFLPGLGACLRVTNNNAQADRIIQAVLHYKYSEEFLNTKYNSRLSAYNLSDVKYNAIILPLFDFFGK